MGVGWVPAVPSPSSHPMATDAFRLFARPREPAPGTAHGVMEAAVLQVPVLGKAELRAACLAVLGFVPDKVRDQPQKTQKGLCVFLVGTVGFLKGQGTTGGGGRHKDTVGGLLRCHHL